LHLRWLLALIALSTYITGTDSPIPAVLAALILVFNTTGYLLRRAGIPLASPLTAVADLVFISMLISQRGGALSETYLLYTLPIFYLGLQYGWRGAVAACTGTLLAYAGTIAATMQVVVLPPEFDPASHFLVRLLYFVFVTAVVSLIVREQTRNQHTVAQADGRIREQVRRLEAIQRITEKLNTAPASADVARVIAEETRGVIPFKNCRVHVVESGPDGVWLPLVAFYGQLANDSPLPAGALRVRPGEGITGWVAVHGEPLLIHDAMHDPRARHIPGTPYTPNSLLAVPVLRGKQLKGVIVLGQAGLHAFCEDDLNLMMTLANAAAIALTNIESRESLARQARTDAVTGLPHHGAFQAALVEAMEEATRRDEALALALLDIDGFRSYNERMGLAAADRALRHVGMSLEHICRTASTPPPTGPVADTNTGCRAPQVQCFRIGGDEFALLLSGPKGCRDAAIDVVRECIRAVSAGQPDPVQRVTVSAGLALFPMDATSRAELLDTAEAALYLVRQTGGNRLGRADAEARETLHLRHTLEQMVQASLAESGSAEAVQHLIAEAAGVSRSSRHATLAEQLTTEALRALAAAIDAKDDYTRGHSERVAATATEIARRMGIPLTEVEHVTTAARMHDIGKIGVPDHILHKGSALTAEEQAIVATHPDVGARILAPIHTLREVVPIVRHHHEHYDGNGYPLGLCGEDIPLGARVVAVADAIDAMITDRPYRRGMQITVALTELQRWAGSHYDPQVVATAVQLYGAGGTGLALRGVLPAARATQPSDSEAAAAMAAPLGLVLRPEAMGAPAEFALRAIVRGDAETRPAPADIPR
jgi:HD-GYP domain-containing protein (c-di-GMP phosphodiesterase class II)/GAF domain-containing protein